MSAPDESFPGAPLEFYPAAEGMRRQRYVPPKEDEEDETIGGAVVNILLRLGCVSTPVHLVDGCQDLGEPLDPPHPLDGVAATYEEAVDIDFHRRQQKILCEQIEMTFLTEFKAMFDHGFRLVLHSTGVYQAHTLYLENDTLSWRPVGRICPNDPEESPEALIFVSKTISKRTILPIKDIIHIQKGGTGLDHDIDCRCILLISQSSRTIFETVDSETSQLLFEGFTLLAKHIHHPRAETTSDSPKSFEDELSEATSFRQQHEELDYDECSYDDLLDEDIQLNADGNNKTLFHSASNQYKNVVSYEFHHSPEEVGELVSL